MLRFHTNQQDHVLYLEDLPASEMGEAGHHPRFLDKSQSAHLSVSSNDLPLRRHFDSKNFEVYSRFSLLFLY